MKKRTSSVLAALLAGCLLQADPVGAISQAAERWRSTELFHSGQYREAMLGFMNLVVEDPRNEKDREYLGRAAALLLEEEKRGAALERLELLRGAQAARAKLDEFERRREERLDRWELMGTETVRLASAPGGMRKALFSYKRMLLKTPVYSDWGPGFSAAAVSVKRVLYKSGGDTAAAFMEGAAEEPPASGTYSGRSRALPEEEARIRRLEERLVYLFNAAGRAIRFYRAGEYGEAEPLWRELLKFDAGNEEALLYLELAAGHEGKAREEALPPAAEEQAPAIVATPARTMAGRPAVKAPREIKVKKTALAGLAAETADDLYEKGVREFSVENYDTAMNYWRKCLRLDPLHLKAKLGLERARLERREE